MGLACGQFAVKTGTVLLKANLLKSRDAKLPVYGDDLRQRGCQRTGCTMHLERIASQAVPVIAKFIPEAPQRMLRVVRAYLACSDARAAAEILRDSGN